MEGRVSEFYRSDQNRQNSENGEEQTALISQEQLAQPVAPVPPAYRSASVASAACPFRIANGRNAKS